MHLHPHFFAFHGAILNDVCLFGGVFLKDIEAFGLFGDEENAFLSFRNCYK